MSREIQPLKPSVASPPSFWTMFLDATDPPAFSWARIMGFLVIMTFLVLAVYFSIQAGALIVPSKEWVYVVVAFAASKPIQRYSESRECESQRNYDFQMAQLNMGILNSTTTQQYPQQPYQQYPQQYQQPYQQYPQQYVPPVVPYVQNQQPVKQPPVVPIVPTVPSAPNEVQMPS